MKRILNKIVDVKPEEISALWLGVVFNFIVLGSYYVLRPIREEIGAAGRENLPWMFTATLIAMLIANALFSATVARMSRRRFIPIAYRFFIASLILFYVLMQILPPAQNVWVGRAFFVWVSVFNLFVVTVFWAFMTDVFTTDQGKRLFGFIAVGGTVGAFLGSTVTALLVRKIGAPNLFFVSAAMLEAGAWCVRFFPADFERQQRQLTSSQAEKPIGGALWAGITHIVQSPYLLGICAFILLHAITGTFVYLQQADIVAPAISDRAARTAFFAHLDQAVNLIVMIVQISLTGRLLKWFGVGATLAFLPLINIVGFISLGFMPVLGLLAAFQIMRRAADYAVSRPAREVLYTVLRQEDKYKAKSFMDTFVYRTGDQLGVWSYRPLLTGLGLGLTGISFVAAPLAAIWLGLSLWLGRKQIALAHARKH